MPADTQERIRKLRRWSAALAVTVALMMAGVYLYRQQQERLARKMLPPPVPASVGQVSAGFTFSKMDRGRTLFTIHATRATEFKERKHSLLEDVSIVVFGSDGSRQDRVTSERCEYLPEQGEVTCPDSVRITFESARAAAREALAPAKPPGEEPAAPFQMTTSAVRFVEETGVAATDQAIVFRFPGGSGRARGLTYRARQETLRLERDVEISAERRDGPVTLRAAAVEFQRVSNQLRFFPPLEARQGGRRITAGSLMALLDSKMRLARVEAEGQVTGTVEQANRNASFRADRLTSHFVNEKPAQVSAEGSVNLKSIAPRSLLGLQAHQVTAYFASHGDRVEQIEAGGGVEVTLSPRSAGSDTPAPGEKEQKLTAPGLRVRLKPGTKPESAETVGGGTLVIADARERQTISGDVLRANFGDRGQLQTLFGGRHARLEMLDLSGASKARGVATSDELVIEWDPSGHEMVQIQQKGNFRYQQGEQSARAAHAIYDLRKATIVLSGSPELSDRASRTTAGQITLFRDRNELEAEGGVQTTYLPAPSGATVTLPGGRGAVNVKAKRMRARGDEDWVQYDGRVRLWQGEDAVESDMLEINWGEKRRSLVAAGDVRSVVHILATGKKGGKSENEKPSGVYRIHSGRMSFAVQDNLIRYEGSVETAGDFGRLTSDALEMRLAAPPGSGRATGTTVERIVALGKVRIVQPGRRGQSERAEYFPAEGTLVLSGGTPTIEDDELGTVTGATLTFKNAGASITVESQEGKRTLSRHQLAP